MNKFVVCNQVYEPEKGCNAAEIESGTVAGGRICKIHDAAQRGRPPETLVSQTK